MGRHIIETTQKKQYKQNRTQLHNEPELSSIIGRWNSANLRISLYCNGIARHGVGDSGRKLKHRP
jgi:hypothetical protein